MGQGVEGQLRRAGRRVDERIGNAPRGGSSSPCHACLAPPPQIPLKLAWALTIHKVRSSPAAATLALPSVLQLLLQRQPSGGLASPGIPPALRQRSGLGLKGFSPCSPALQCQGLTLDLARVSLKGM